MDAHSKGEGTFGIHEPVRVYDATPKLKKPLKKYCQQYKTINSILQILSCACLGVHPTVGNMKKPFIYYYLLFIAVEIHHAVNVDHFHS